MLNAYKLKNSNTVVTDPDSVDGTSQEDYETVSLVIPMQSIKEWAEEIEMLGLDDDD